MKKTTLFVLMVLFVCSAAVRAQVGTYFQAQIKKNGTNLEFYIRANPIGNGGSNITNFKFDNLDFWVRQPLSSPVPTFGAPVVNTTDFPGLTISKDPFGVESNPYGDDPTYRLIEWTSPVGGATNTAMPYNAGQEYLVFTVPVSANFPAGVFQLAGDNENGAPYYFSITRNTAGVGGISDYTSHGANGNVSLQLFYTSGAASLLTSGATPGIGGGISFYGQMYVAGALPVTFTNYDVRCVDKGAMLTWTTSFEQNTKNFEIQRTKNGVDWTTIGTVAAAGNSNDNLNYQYIDLSNSGTFQYRIKQNDIDGRFVFTATRVTNCHTSKFDVVLYPIPTHDKLNVVIRSESDLVTQLSVVDMYGRTVYTTSASLNKGSTNIIIPTEHLAAGQYILVSKDPAVQISSKFTVAH
jgi:hypothetical protein